MGAGKIISVHSYRGGTGKSNITANLAACGLAMGKRIAVLDTDIQSPGIHVLFGIDPGELTLTLVDFLWNQCTIDETAYDVTRRIDGDTSGRCWLVPASLTAHAISRILDEGYDVKRLNSHFDDLIDHFDLDYLLIDTHPGLNKETMLTTAISDTLILLIRPDQQDYYGSAIVSKIASQLEVPHIYLVANKVYSHIDPKQLEEKLKQAFGHEVIGALPLSEDLARLESRKLIVRENPDGAISMMLKKIAGLVFT